MAKEDQYLSYEQALQELQIDRSHLNRLIREGLLKEQVVGGEGKFSLADVRRLKASLEKRPTVVEEEAGAKESLTDLMGPGPGKPKEPKTELLEGVELEKAERETDVLKETPAQAAVERDTEILEEKEFELEEPASTTRGASETALETELELKRAQEQAAAEAKPGKKEDLFELAETPEELALELEEPAPAAAEKPAAKPPEEEEIITDVLSLEKEEEVPEEDLLSEIMEIGEEEEAPRQEAAAGEETEDLTAEITTMEEPTYEESALDTVLEAEEEAPGAEAAAEEFEVPYAAPVVGAEVQVGGLWLAVLVLTLIIMVFAGLFVVENSFRPEFSTHLTSWALRGQQNR
jgi:hypothetical protein